MRPVTLDRNMTPQQRSRAFLDRGRHAMRTAGGYISDLVSLRKAIILCSLCEHKFAPAPVGYIIPWNLRYGVRGFCDGCRAMGTHRIFLHKDHLPR